MKNIEVFYTGGGIWLSEINLQNGTYAVISSDFPECLSIYNYVEDENQYMPEDMIFSGSVKELNEEQTKIYNQLLIALKKEV